MRSTEVVLSQMVIDIEAGVPEHVFALVAGVRGEDIQAVAAISRRGQAAPLGGAEGEVLYSVDLAVTPAKDRRAGVAVELIRQLGEWAGARGLTPVLDLRSGDIAEYYFRLRSERPARGQTFRLVELEF